jgi:NaMN:DMB phosphoribosyltransferase
MFASGSGVGPASLPHSFLSRLEAAGRAAERNGPHHAAPADACGEASDRVHLGVLAIWLSCVERAVTIWSGTKGFWIMTLPGTPSAEYCPALSPEM